MGDFDDSFVEELKTQSWSLYAVGMFMVILRVIARIKRLGIRNLQIDDYLMIFAGSLYTALVVCLNVIAGGGGSNLYPPEAAGTFTEDEIRDRIYGSKIVVVSEQAMLNVIYVIKACMLIMYTRLTLGLTTQKAVRYLACYVALGWFASEIAFFSACRPFEGYWGMPPPDPQCATLQYYAIVQGCFNISSDTLMLFIPLPLVVKMNMPWKQKIVLVFIFSMGLFVIVAALLTKIFNLSDIWDPTYMLWYTREASVAVYVSNLPMIWPLLRDIFPCLRSLTPGGGRTSESSRGKRRTGTGAASITPQGTFPSLQRSRLRGRRSLTSLESAFDLEMALKDTSNRKAKKTGDDSSSTDQIIATTDSKEKTANNSFIKFEGIKVERTVVVREELSPQSSGSGDTRSGIFDWQHAGKAVHKADASRGK